jgi:hypothetical protein
MHLPSLCPGSARIQSRVSYELLAVARSLTAKGSMISSDFPAISLE